MKWLNCAKIRLMLVGFVAAIVIGSGSANADFTFGTVTNLGPTVNSSSDEGIAHTSGDGLELYFYSERPGGYGSADLYVARRQTTHDDWGPPANLGPTVNSSRGDWGPNLSADGLTLFFASDRPGGYGSWDIWITARTTTDADWSAPVNLGATVNSSAEEICPAISADGLQLYFSEWEVFRPGGYGGSDMWVTTRGTASDPWGTPVNLGPTVNSSDHDEGPFITADGLALFFSSERPAGYGKVDIFVARRATTDDDWGTPVNLGPTVNSSGNENVPRISDDDSTLYFSSNPSGGVVGFDLWQASILPVVDFNGDGIVETNDLLTMIEYWGTDEPLCDIGPTPLGDGIVDVQDLEILMSYWGQEAYDPTLAAHWKLDEPEGSVAPDSAGDNDGTCHGDPLWQPTGGQIDGALAFDGTDDYISADFVLNPADGPFSVFAWIKEGAPGQVIISQADRTVFGVTLPGTTWLSTDPAEGKLMTELLTVGRGGVPIVSETVITDGAWHRIGFVWDGSYRHLYVDGAEVAKDTESFSQLEGSRGGLYLGAGSTLDAGSFFSGLIDDVRIYNRAITP